jgi:hypothetical protein
VLHLHHWLLAWYVGTWAAHAHGASAGLLAAAAGVFAQGLGAYGASSAFLTPACRDVLLSAQAIAQWVPSLGCHWNAALATDGMANLQVCPLDATTQALLQSATCLYTRRAPALLR